MNDLQVYSLSSLIYCLLMTLSVNSIKSGKISIFNSNFSTHTPGEICNLGIYTNIIYILLNAF